MRSRAGLRRGLADRSADSEPCASHVPRISLRTSWSFTPPVRAGSWLSADSIAMIRLSRYSSSCSKQMYSTLAWPPSTMLRAIWTAIVVLPVPCAPPISSSSPARNPPPIVLSRGEKPSGTGWYCSTAPVATLPARVDSTSVALRGWTTATPVSKVHSTSVAGFAAGAGAGAVAGADAWGTSSAAWTESNQPSSATAAVSAMSPEPGSSSGALAHGGVAPGTGDGHASAGAHAPMAAASSAQGGRSATAVSSVVEVYADQSTSGNGGSPVAAPFAAP